MRVVGIDNGLKGGVACLCDISGAMVEPMPRTADRKSVNEFLLAAIMREMCAGASLLVVEHAQPFPGQGLVSTCTTCLHFGMIRGIWAMLDPPVSIKVVTARKWQAALLPTHKLPQATRGSSEKLRKGVAVERRLMLKRMSIDTAASGYPKVSLYSTEQSKKPSDGMADALHIAAWGYLQATGRIWVQPPE